MFYREITKKYTDIVSLKAEKEDKRRDNGSYPKTDVKVTVITSADPQTKYIMPISIKQTKAAKVTMAEFDVNTMRKELNISNKRLKKLLEKHQKDGSAKRFSKDEKKELTELLSANDLKTRLVRWVVTGTPDKFHADDRYPDYILKYQLDNKKNIKDINLFPAEVYVEKIMKKDGNPRKGGFGTGLSWTYATGSKGYKIQFKG